MGAEACIIRVLVPNSPHVGLAWPGRAENEKYARRKLYASTDVLTSKLFSPQLNAGRLIGCRNDGASVLERRAEAKDQ